LVKCPGCDRKLNIANLGCPTVNHFGEYFTKFFCKMTQKWQEGFVSVVTKEVPWRKARMPWEDRMPSQGRESVWVTRKPG
jgi:hypothetical protein